MSISDKIDNKHSSGMVFDTQKKIVLASLPKENKGIIERKIADVKEVVPNRSKHEIGLVLQFYEYNVNEAISAFLEDRAASVLNEWNCTTNKPNKNRKKSEAKKESIAAKDSMAVGGDLVVVVPVNDVKVPQKVDVRLDKVDSRVERKRTSTVSSQLSDNSTVSSKNISSLKQNSVSNVDDAKQRSKMKSLEKPIKELGQHSVSLQRAKNLLSDEMNRSEKRLKQSFQELHRLLEEREAELAKELNEAKDEASRLLAARISRAEGLKVGTNRVVVMNDNELKELRIDIKHFVSERKFDDDLGRTVRFVRDHDRIIKEIKSYGEVVPVKSLYTGRRLSVSSAVSSLGQSEPSPVSVTTTVAAAVTTTVVAPAVTAIAAKSESNVTSSSSSEMSTAEISELHQRLQESLRLQGLSFDTTSTRITRPNYKQRRTVNSQSSLSYTNNSDSQNNHSGSSQQSQSKNGRPSFHSDDGTLNKSESRSGRRSFGLSRDQNYRTKSRNVGHGQAPSAGGQP